MGYPDAFEGYTVNSKKNSSDFHRMSYKPKRFEDYDIDTEISRCNVCTSDYTSSGANQIVLLSSAMPKN